VPTIAARLKQASQGAHAMTASRPGGGILSRRRVLGLGVLAVGTGVGGGALVYPHIDTARVWYDVIGVDVSHHQGNIDWPTLAGTDVSFAYIKATEGGDFRDPRFQTNWQRAKQAGLVRGAYHFFTQCRSGADQARNFIDAVPREAGALPPALDLEHMGPCRSGPQLTDLVAEISTFLAMVQDHYGRRPILYVTWGFDWLYLRGGFTGETFWTRSIFWPPWFRTDAWLIWQYHSCGRRAGVNGPVDLNAFRGSQRDLVAFAAGQPVRGLGAGGLGARSA
jgi:lysozyme